MNVILTIAITALAAFLAGVACARLPRIRSWRSGVSMPVGGAVLAAITIDAIAAGAAPKMFSPGGLPVSLGKILFGLFVALCLLRLITAPRWMLAVTVIAAAFATTRVGLQIDSIKVPFVADFVDLGSLTIPLTVFWMFAIAWLFGETYAVPGLTPGIGAIAGMTLLILSYLQPQGSGNVTSLFAAALTGACAGGFFPSLRSPMFAAGHAGSLTLGFCLAIITVLGALKNTAFLILLLPLLIVGTPLIDFTFAGLFSPKGSERSGAFAFTQSREPLHRALIRNGWSPQRVTLLYLAMETYLCVIAIALVLLIRAHFLIKLAVLLPFAAVGWFLFTSIAKLLARPDGREVSSDKIDLLDVHINAVSMQQALAHIESFIQSRTPHMVVTSDASAVVRSQQDDDLHRIINEADLVTPDGIGVIWSARFLDLPLYERVPGVDLAMALCELSAKKGYSVYLLGAAPGVAEEAAHNLQQKFPGLRIAGTQHGYFQPEENDSIVQQICQAKPDILLVAFGVPKQEKWIKKHLQSLQVPVCIGVGGSFDVYAGRVQRAPAWVQRMGMEWLYRTARDPKRIGRAMLLPRLVLLTLKRRWFMVNG